MIGFCGPIWDILMPRLTRWLGSTLLGRSTPRFRVSNKRGHFYRNPALVRQREDQGARSGVVRLRTNSPRCRRLRRLNLAARFLPRARKDFRRHEGSLGEGQTSCQESRGSCGKGRAGRKAGGHKESGKEDNQQESSNQEDYRVPGHYGRFTEFLSCGVLDLSRLLSFKRGCCQARPFARMWRFGTVRPYAPVLLPHPR